MSRILRTIRVVVSVKNPDIHAIEGPKSQTHPKRLSWPRRQHKQTTPRTIA